jgi:hypothetical protein
VTVVSVRPSPVSEAKRNPALRAAHGLRLESSTTWRKQNGPLVYTTARGMTLSPRRPAVGEEHEAIRRARGGAP